MYDNSSVGLFPWRMQEDSCIHAALKGVRRVDRVQRGGVAERT